MAREDVEGASTLLLAAPVARRFSRDGASTSDIAGELDPSRFKVARLFEQARASGLVRIEVDGPAGSTSTFRCASGRPTACAGASSSTPRTTATRCCAPAWAGPPRTCSATSSPPTTSSGSCGAGRSSRCARRASGSEIAGALPMAGQVTKAVVGVGAWQPGLSTVADAVSDSERRAAYAAGVGAEIGASSSTARAAS